MENRYLWIAIGLLFVMNLYTIYTTYYLQEDIGAISYSMQWNIGAISQNISALSGRISQYENYRTTTEQQKVQQEFFTIDRSIPIVAVSNNGNGVIGNLTVKLIPGNNNVLINTNPFLETDLQYSVNKAVVVAKSMSEYSYNKDFLFDFRAGDSKLIGGESAGAAITIATTAALQNKSLTNNAVITGTINPDGGIGQIGAVIEKAKAVADAGYTYFLVPKGQSKVTYYEKQITKEPAGYGFEILNTRYIPKTIDLTKVAKEQWNLEIVEVSAINDALPYFIEEQNATG